VVFHSLDHDSVLKGGSGHLHPSGVANGGVGNVTVTGNLIGGIDNDNAPIKVIGQDAGNLTQHGGLAHTGASQKHNALARLNQVFDDLYGTEDGPTDAAGKPNDATFAVTDGGNTVQSPLDSRPIVIAKAADAGDYIVDVRLVDFLVSQLYLPTGKAGFRGPSQVKNNFQQFTKLLLPAQRLADMCRYNFKQSIKVVGNYLLQRTLPNAVIDVRQQYPENTGEA
jgi:hypothetical protein